jgi:hypothetical protein
MAVEGYDETSRQNVGVLAHWFSTCDPRQSDEVDHFVEVGFLSPYVDPSLVGDRLPLNAFSSDPTIAQYQPTDPTVGTMRGHGAESEFGVTAQVVFRFLALARGSVVLTASVSLRGGELQLERQMSVV